jgi:hypothetical protein
VNKSHVKLLYKSDTHLHRCLREIVRITGQICVIFVLSSDTPHSPPSRFVRPQTLNHFRCLIRLYKASAVETWWLNLAYLVRLSATLITFRHFSTFSKLRYLLSRHSGALRKIVKIPSQHASEFRKGRRIGAITHYLL